MINADQQQLWKSFTVSGSSCVFSQNDELLIVGCSDCNILIYDIIHNTVVNRLVDSFPILALFALPGLLMSIFIINSYNSSLICIVGYLRTTNYRWYRYVISPKKMNIIRAF